MQKDFDVNRLTHYYEQFNLEAFIDRSVLKSAQLQHFAKGEFVLLAGDALDYFYYLVAGQVRIVYGFENGKGMQMKIYKPLATIGDIELYRKQLARCDVEAVTEVTLIAIPIDEIHAHHMTDTKFLCHLVDTLSQKLDATIINSSYNSVYPLTNRVASFLLERSIDGETVVLQQTYKALAQFFGTSYRHLNRTLKEMEAKQLIHFEGKKVYLDNQQSLQELAKDLYVMTF